MSRAKGAAERGRRAWRWHPNARWHQNGRELDWRERQRWSTHKEALQQLLFFNAPRLHLSTPVLTTLFVLQLQRCCRAPAAAHYCEPLRTLGLTTETSFYLLTPPSPNPHLVAVHPGSGSPQKNWPLSRWVELCRWLHADHHAELLIITGEADGPAATALAPFGTSAHQLPLAQLVARLTQCRRFLGHDSGISHLAAACGVPSVLLFGPTDPALWAPPAPHVTVIRRGPSLAEISLADVQAALRPLFTVRK